MELIDEEQARELHDSVAAGQEDQAMARLLAPRLEQRARTVAAQLSHREVAYAIIGLQLALMQAADTLTLILEERLHSARKALAKRKAAPTRRVRRR